MEYNDEEFSTPEIGTLKEIVLFDQEEYAKIDPRRTTDGRYFPVPTRKDCCPEHQPIPLLNCRQCLYIRSQFRKKGVSSAR